MKGNRRRLKQERSHPTTTLWSGTRVRAHAYAHMTIAQRYQALFNWIASSQQNNGTPSCMVMPGCDYARLTPEAIAASMKEAD
jgi:hypothetical protein